MPPLIDVGCYVLLFDMRGFKGCVRGLVCVWCS
jgi:hypothetical protein